MRAPPLTVHYFMPLLSDIRPLLLTIVLLTITVTNLAATKLAVWNSSVSITVSLESAGKPEVKDTTDPVLLTGFEHPNFAGPTLRQ